MGAWRFVLVFVDTPLDVCEQRDTKGVHAKARRGELPAFTGIDDPYDRPNDADIVLTTTDASPGDNARQILDYLVKPGFLREEPGTEASAGATPVDSA